MFLLLMILCQALPVEAFAATGKVLSDAELAHAYALTGLGTGLLADSAAYHSGMKPVASWNASQLQHHLALAEDLCSRIFVFRLECTKNPSAAYVMKEAVDIALR